LLDVLALPDSNRDPICEFCEHLAQALLGGALADNRVQRDWDLRLPGGALVQVRLGIGARPRSR